MAQTWGEIRDKIRSAVLKDVLAEDQTEEEYRWTDGELLVGCEWALAQFAAHTAVATATGFAPATGTVYQLPDNLYDGDGAEQTLFVYITRPSSADVVYLDPVRYTPGLTPMNGAGYSILPDGTLRLTEGSKYEDSTLYVQYFAYYTPPVQDEDLITVPRWAEMVICYLAGAHVLSGSSLKSANIRQWLANPDRGNPEDNPLRAQQKWFLGMAEKELLKHPVQDRVNAFRSLSDNLER